MLEEVQIIPFDPKYLEVFVSLNREWIEKNFGFEMMDLKHLENPKESIFDPGGEIFFVLNDGRAVGTCAMIPHGRRDNGSVFQYQLIKMAVAETKRGKGYGDLLMDACIHWANNKGADSILILSNTILKPAIELYKKYGARVVRLGHHPDYHRCDIEMMIPLRG